MILIDGMMLLNAIRWGDKKGVQWAVKTDSVMSKLVQALRGL